MFSSEQIPISVLITKTADGLDCNNKLHGQQGKRMMPMPLQVVFKYCVYSRLPSLKVSYDLLVPLCLSLFLQQSFQLF